jgi:hypothetical protein
MPFVAQCTFCRVMLQGVPDHCLGSSVECPRCHSSFTLAPMANPPPPAARESKAVPKVPAAPQRAPAEQVQVKPGLGEKSTDAAALALETPLEEEAPPRRAAAARPYSLPEPAQPDYVGLASFLLGSFAFLAAAILHVGLITFALGLLGLALGVFGILRPSAGPRRLVLPVAGTAVSLPAVLIAAFLPHWLGLGPLWGARKPPNFGRDAAISLGGDGGLRRAADGEILWVDASRDALHHGNVRLRVVSPVVVGPVPFVAVPGKQPPGDRCLRIGLRITNAGLGRNLSYFSWGVAAKAQDRPVLRDDQGKAYAEKAFAAGWVVKGRVANAGIPPGKTLDDVLVFEAPPKTVQHLRLELPASAVGGSGTLHMEIPRQMIAFR